MNIAFPVSESVAARYSVRNYIDQEIDAETRQLLADYISSLKNPFGRKVNFHYLDGTDLDGNEKLGTYGVIKGADKYIGTTIREESLALEALGYELEAVMLLLAHKGLGTCWLGGTFNRKGFSRAMHISKDELFPIITPYGYPAAKKHIKEVMMRKMVKADQRKDWSELFFKNDFQTPMTLEEAADLAYPLEMVRLGPSASNKQPWRLLLTDNACHFYEYKTPGYSDIFSYDIQRIDMGIAACHFDFAAREKGISGQFDATCDPGLACPDHVSYVFSWKM